MQLPSERGAQPGPIFCSVTHPAALGVLQRKHSPHMPVLQGCSQLLGAAGWVTVPDVGGKVWEWHRPAKGQEQVKDVAVATL